jgi:hypothetical protein
MIWDGILDGIFVVGFLDFPVGFIWHMLDTFDRRAMNNGIGFHGILKCDWPPLEKLQFGVPCCCISEFHVDFQSLVQHWQWIQWAISTGWWFSMYGRLSTLPNLRWWYQLTNISGMGWKLKPTASCYHFKLST